VLRSTEWLTCGVVEGEPRILAAGPTTAAAEQSPLHCLLAQREASCCTAFNVRGCIRSTRCFRCWASARRNTGVLIRPSPGAPSPWATSISRPLWGGR
jgi:hypothetical protein